MGLLEEDEDYAKRRKKNADLTFRKMLEENLGKKCRVCGKEEGIEYHHLKALKDGGTNDLWNIIPVCQEHHKWFHGKEHHQNKKNGGRPASVPREEAFTYYDMWAWGGCCESELKRMLKMSPKTHTKEGRWYEEWVKDRRISEVRNFIEKNYWPEMRAQKVDYHSWRDAVPEGSIVSEIKYLDTATERFYHRRLSRKA